MLKPHAHRADLLALVQQSYEASSLYDEAIHLLHRQGIAIPQQYLERDWRRHFRRGLFTQNARCGAFS